MANITFELKEKLLVFGAIEILSGAIILVLGVFLGSMQGIFDFFGDFSFFTFYSGYPIWGPLSFIFTGSSSIASGRDLLRILEQARYPRYLFSAVIALLGVMVLSANLALNNVWWEDCPYSKSPDLCLYMGTSNNKYSIFENQECFLINNNLKPRKFNLRSAKNHSFIVEAGDRERLPSWPQS